MSVPPAVVQVLISPFHFRSGAMQLAVMGPAEGDGELITDLLSKTVRLGKAQMMRVTWLVAVTERAVSRFS